MRLGDRQSETDTGGPGSVLMVLPSFGGARESRNLLPTDLADAESEAAVSLGGQGRTGFD